MDLRFLHLSNLKLDYGPKMASPEEAIQKNPVAHSILETVENLIQQGKYLDFILISGDLAKAGKGIDYEVALFYCERLLEKAELDPSRLFMVPGNHDVNLNKEK